MGVQGPSKMLHTTGLGTEQRQSQRCPQDDWERGSKGKADLEGDQQAEQMDVAGLEFYRMAEWWATTQQVNDVIGTAVQGSGKVRNVLQVKL